MSTRQFVRRLGGGVRRRTFSTSPSTLNNTTTSGGGAGGALGRSATENAGQEQGPGSASGPGQQFPKWSGRSVFALTATAGVLGFGLSAATLQQQQQQAAPNKHRVMLFDSKTPTPQYASLDEMELVGLSRTLPAHSSFSLVQCCFYLQSYNSIFPLLPGFE